MTKAAAPVVYDKSLLRASGWTYCVHVNASFVNNIVCCIICTSPATKLRCHAQGQTWHSTTGFGLNLAEAMQFVVAARHQC
jgi:hypothetical protein